MTTGCQLALGGDTTSGRVVGAGELDSQVTVQLSPGALRSPNDSPEAWLSTPDADITFTSSDESPGDIVLPVANVHPDAEVRIQTIRGIGTSDDPDCSRNNNTVDCQQSDDPLCRRGDYTSDAATAGRIQLELPTCYSATLTLAPPEFSNEDRGATVAVLGNTSSASVIPTAARRATDRDADLLVLLGDHSGGDQPVDNLADSTDDLPIPVVTLPGEDERTDNSLVSFERRFGPVDIAWSIGGIDFVGPDTSSGGLGREGIDELRSQLRPFGRSTPLVAVMHRPPLDPDGFRDSGFSSRIEGARAVSLLSSFSTDQIVAGHLDVRTRDSLADIPMQVVSSRAPRRLWLAEFSPNASDVTTRWLDF